MDYRYESLNDQSFQKLCQALIVAEHPDTLCLPVAQPDGGRDAYLAHGEPDSAGLVIFQIKFSRDFATKTERDAVVDLVKSDRDKVKKLLSRGATEYYLITNVRGTAHLATGSIDRAAAELTRELGLQSRIWWRDDLDRRLDNAFSIRWSYPEILPATDVLPLLLRNFQPAEHLQPARALRSYIAAQYTTDSDIKFKQTDLEHRLADLFVDLPLSLKRPAAFHHKHPPDATSPAAWSNIDPYVSQLLSDDDPDEPIHFEHRGLAAAFVLQMPLQNGISRFVLEGAPGQGKSTVSQFICQVHRLRLLRKVSELQNVAPGHKDGVPTRTPFRVDLRHYASWVSGVHPFDDSTAPTTIPDDGRRSLEGFLSMQVTRHSGGLEVTSHQLLELLAQSHSVLVLDGFDEVADINIRKRVVDEICQASERLDQHTESMQIVVTSRPAAFANSPGFPDDWIHLELRDLRPDNIAEYRDKWLTVQRLPDDEKRKITSTLRDKLEQPHLRDLARNPMQLAILLHLIHMQGVALPEKRTTLYDKYIELFFNREAEKSPVVRDHRELLLSIQGVLAWILHTRAEEGGTGNISKAELQSEVKTYLETKEHDPRLTDDLFRGTVERIGALVSRVVGVYEFEVQPLREYFAARHLYKTAPYSPPGRQCKGTRPERFEALARSLYWTNVTRFFCGFYDVGELAGLVESILELGKHGDYRLINQPRRLAMMLLSDRVFSQMPKAVKRLVEFVVADAGFDRLCSNEIFGPDAAMSLPAQAGGSALFAKCVARLETEEDPLMQHAFRAVMAENGTREELMAAFKARLQAGTMKCEPLHEALDLGIAHEFRHDDLSRFVGDDAVQHVNWLIVRNDYEEVMGRPELIAAAKKAFFRRQLIGFHHRMQRSGPNWSIVALTPLARPGFFPRLLAEDGARGRYYSRTVEQFRQDCVDPLYSFAGFARDLFAEGNWRTDLRPWSELVNRGLAESEDNEFMLEVAFISTACEGTSSAPDRVATGHFAPTRGLVERLFFARQRGDDVGWWQRAVVDVNDATACQLLAMLAFWGGEAVIRDSLTKLQALASELSRTDWTRVCSMIDALAWALMGRGAPAGPAKFPVGRLDIESPRLAYLLLGRCDDAEEMRNLGRACFGDYGGEDVEVIHGAARTELVGGDGARNLREIDWEYIKGLSRQARRIGTTLAMPLYGTGPLEVPRSVAASVLDDYGNYCAQLVAVCEQALAMEVAQGARRVGDVADIGRWFEDAEF